MSHAGTLAQQHMVPVRPPDPEPVAEWSPVEVLLLAAAARRAAMRRGNGNPYATEAERVAARQATYRRYRQRRKKAGAA
jgi:hypothetical protein